MGEAAVVIALVISIFPLAHGEAHSNLGKKTFAFGEFLKPPPPPPPLGNLLPVPFHGGGPRVQRQNIDLGYQYPPPPPGPLPPSGNFKFPAPFYRQYNFNFVPPPQPFTTTPSPTMFQKVSSWLFPIGQSQPEPTPIISPPIKKDCNPCNLAPWIPVLRYDLTGKKLQQSSYPTYGPPSPTAIGNAVQSGYQYPAPSYKPFNYNQNLQTGSGIPHANYGPPVSFVSTPSSTYGPPSPTHVPISSNRPQTSTHISSSTYGIPSSSYGVPSSSFSVPSSSYGIPSSSYGIPSSTYGNPSSTYNPSSTFGSPLPPLETSVSDTNFRPVTPDYGIRTPNYEPPQINSVEFIENHGSSADLTLPKVSQPTGFKNSYGEPITNNFALDIPYPVSATAAESSKIKTEVYPNAENDIGLNETFSVAKPSPFSINKGRNIHTLQPVALPNLSVSPLPPIFNARPFRPNTKIYLNNLHGINSLQQNKDNVDISPSLYVTDISHTVDYPATLIQSPIVDVTSFNQSKSYRKIPSYSEDYFHDVSSQASEDHIASTNTNNNVPESSFESTGLEYDNEIIDHSIPLDFRKNNGGPNIPPNHKPLFTDLRGMPEDDVDKFRTESNLQFIDSPLLYLKPSAPHKGYDNFVTPLSTGQSGKDYELYDDIQPTTFSPEQSTFSETWNKGKLLDFDQGLLPPPISQNNKKKPKLVQIIIPYTTNNNEITNADESGSQDWISASADESQGRKVPTQTLRYPEYNKVTEDYKTTELLDENTVTEETDPIKYNTHAILNDLYDVKEPPFDIIKFQHNIDDWTEQEYAKEHSIIQKARPNGKYAYAKTIPDDYFTTPNPTTQNYNHNYNHFDYEGSSSIQHTVRDDSYKKSYDANSLRHHNTIQKEKDKSNVKNFNIEDLLKPHIYTASSSFRSSTATPAPWEKIQTSISPLTKEKIYVVTSKPWPEKSNITTWYSGAPFESKKTTIDNDVSASDNLPFKSPRFINRPHIEPSALGRLESLKADSSYSFSKSWHQRINDLDPGVPASRNSTSAIDRSEGAILKVQPIMDEVMIETTTAENYEVTTTDASVSSTTA